MKNGHDSHTTLAQLGDVVLMNSILYLVTGLDADTLTLAQLPSGMAVRVDRETARLRLVVRCKTHISVWIEVH